MTTDVTPGERTGTCAFRLMPTDDLVDAPSSLSVASVAAGRATLLTYAWRHPEDGDQAGTLLLGTPDDEGTVTASWIDSWHQPTVTVLTGDASVVGYEYDPGWRWEVEVGQGDGTVTMVMHNVVPEQDGQPSVRYDVMRASWA